MVRGASSGKQQGSNFIFESADGGAGLIVSGGSTITTSGNLTIGGIGRVFGTGSIVCGGVSVVNNVVTFGSSETVEKTSYGLKISLPDTKQLEINGKRFDVRSLSSSGVSQVAETPAEREKITVYRVSQGLIDKVVLSNYAKLDLSRFPALAIEALEFDTSEYSELRVNGHFAVRNLRATASGYSKLKGEGGNGKIFAAKATLNTNSFAKLCDVYVTGLTSANSSGHSSLEVFVVDKDKADNDQTGFSKCRVSLMGKESILQATLALTNLDAGSAAAATTTKTEVKNESDETKKRKRPIDIEDDRDSKR